MDRNWYKSSYSLPQGQNCVQTRATDDGGVQVRDSKRGDAGPVLTFTGDEWSAFIAGVRGGEFETPTA